MIVLKFGGTSVDKRKRSIFLTVSGSATVRYRLVYCQPKKSLTVVVDELDTGRAVRALHNEFFPD